MSIDYSNSCQDTADTNLNETPEVFDLYKFIPPPNPLIPKNKYTESAPKSLLQLGIVRKFIGIENEDPLAKDAKTTETLAVAETIISSFYSSKNVVFKRNSELCDFININKFTRKTEKSNKQLVNFYTPSINDNTLVFESRFESGNLDLAVKVSDFEYNLLMQNDINTRGHTQWFYFRVSNTRQHSYKFNILNFTKPDSLFNYGMKVLIFSECENLHKGTSWFRAGEEISYLQNNIRRGSKSYFTLSFTYTFHNSNDVVYFAYSFPYTYSNLMEDLQKVENLSFVNRKLLCFSIGGNRCDYLTITAPGSPEELKARKGVFFTARVHPGETVGSWMAKGLIEYLTSSHPQAEELRRKFVFKIVPMMNPDGVINGNYRCGLAGVDLNRRWKSPNEKIHPTVYHCKKLIKAFAKERKIELICDFHGHSRRKNIFAYGCNVIENPCTTRIFPLILSKTSQFFSYKFCSFRMQKAKEGTMRICLFKELKVPLIYTIEASFCGCDSNISPAAGQTHFTTKNLEKMGEDVCTALFAYSSHSESNSFLKEFVENKSLLEENDLDSSGSDSDPSEDNLDSKELKVLYNKEKSAKVFTSLRKNIRSGSSTKKDLQQKASFCKNVPQSSREVKKQTYFAKPFGRKTAVNGRERNFFSLPYFNLNGKKVRDQATQTYRDDKGNLLDDRVDKNERCFSVISGSEFEKSSENSFIFKPKNALPSIGKNNKTFMNFIVGEKMKTGCNIKS